MDARDTHSRSRCRSIGVPRRRARVKAQTGKKRNLQFVAVQWRLVHLSAVGGGSTLSLNLVGRRTRRGGAGARVVSHS